MRERPTPPCAHCGHPEDAHWRLQAMTKRADGMHVTQDVLVCPTALFTVSGQTDSSAAREG
jgi:hypothetical protein